MQEEELMGIKMIIKYFPCFLNPQPKVHPQDRKLKS